MSRESATRAARLGARCSGAVASCLGAGCPSHAAVDDGSIFGFKGSQRGVKQLPLGDDHDVKPRRDLRPTENLSNQSFGSISLNRAAQFLRGGDAQTAWGVAGPPAQKEQRKEWPMHSCSTLVNLLKLGSPPNPLVA